MDTDVKSAFKQAILGSLMILRPLAGQFTETHLVWRKEGEGRWQGEHQARPGIKEAIAVAHRELKEVCASFEEHFSTRHPEHAGMVGAQRFGVLNLGRDPSHIVRCGLFDIWKRYGTFNVPDAAVNSIADEFEQFVTGSTIRFRFQAQLLNFKMKPDRLAFTRDLTIRRLTEDEVSAFYGGPLEMIHARHHSLGMDEFVIEGEGEEPKVLGQLTEPPPIDRERSLLDKAMLCLRTFSEGKVGYNYVHFQPVGFSPMPYVSLSYGDLHVPLGSYELLEDQIDPLKQYAELMFSTSEAAMEMACSRLSDAEVRLRAQDRIVDAVIGLEALLLAGLGKEDRKSELKYRFSIHYSTLYGSPEDRHGAYRVAKDLYDLRSAIAHGSMLSDGLVRVGDEKVSLADAGKRATSALRMVIRHFLPLAKHAPYKKHDFWERAYFGLPEKELNSQS